MRHLQSVCILSLILAFAGAFPASSDQLTAWIETAIADPNAVLVPIPKTRTLYKAGRARIPFRAGDDTSLSEAIKQHETDELVELGPEALFELIAGEAAAGTRFAKKINVNRPYRRGQLNVYTLRAARPINHIASCAYIGGDAIIICHTDRLLKLITHFVTKDEYLDTAIMEREADGSLRQLKRSQLDPQVRDSVDLTLSGGFLGWILAHEIGHAVLHADKLRSGSYMHFSGGIAGTLERQADEFAAQQILHSDILIQMSISSLSEFIAFEYMRFYSNAANAGRYELTDSADASPKTLRLHLSEKYPEEVLLYRAASINATVTRLDSKRDTTPVPQKEFANLSIETQSSNAVYFVLAASLGVIAVVLFLSFYRGRHA